MKRRILYLSVFVMLYVILHTVISPYLLTLMDRGQLDHYTVHLMLMIGSNAITVMLAIFIMYEGRYHKSFIVIGSLLIATRVFDVARFALFPYKTMEINFGSFWGGIFIFGFAMGLFKDILFRYRIAIFLMVIGIVTFIRFPIYYIDMWLYYYLKYGPVDAGLTTYYTGVMVINYIVVAMGLLALDGIVSNNIESKMYAK